MHKTTPKSIKDINLNHSYDLQDLNHSTTPKTPHLYKHLSIAIICKLTKQDHSYKYNHESTPQDFPS